MSDENFLLSEDLRALMRLRYRSWQEYSKAIPSDNMIAAKRFEHFKAYYLDILHFELHLSADVSSAFINSIDSIKNHLNNAEDISYNIFCQLHRLEMFMNGKTLFSFHQFKSTEKMMYRLIKRLTTHHVQINKCIEMFIPGLVEYLELFGQNTYEFENCEA